MNLHKDDKNFIDLVATVAQTIGLPQVYVEKDYWVTRALKQLSEFEHVDEVVFKGGTSLSKAYKLIDRFSEDIDLAVLSNGMSQNSIKKLLKQVETVASKNLVYLEGDVRESKGSKFRKTVYQYPRSIEDINFGQASSELVIEINAFTNPQPYEKIELNSMIAEVLIIENRQDIIDQYNLHGFYINVLSVKRTLVEKILGMVKNSYDKNPVTKISSRIRHLYDICLILKQQEFRNFIGSSEFKNLSCDCIEDEKTIFLNQSKYFDVPLKDSPLFSEFKSWSTTIGLTYTGVFSSLVYKELPMMKEIEETLDFIRDNL